MKKYLVALAVVVGVVTVGAQNTIIPGESIAFDYSDQIYQDFVVLRFEVRWDNQTNWTAVNPAPFRDAQTLAGHSSYAVAPPFSNGNHSMFARACNVVGCGDSSSEFPFAFAVASVPPQSFGNFRTVKR